MNNVEFEILMGHPVDAILESRAQDYPDKCHELSHDESKTGIHVVSLLWQGMIGGSRWRGLLGTAAGDTYEAARAAAIEAAKRSRMGQ